MEGISNALHLRNLSKTRWSARAESVQAVWNSFEAISEALLDICELRAVDSKTKGQARALLGKLMNLDFITSLMFSKNILMKTKLLSDQLQKESLHVFDATLAIKGTISTLKKIRDDDLDFKRQIQASVTLAEDKFGISAKDHFARHHRPRRPPHRIDEHPETARNLQMMEFHSKEFRATLDVLITELQDNLMHTLQLLQPFGCLQPPLKPPQESQMDQLCNSFPKDKPDVHAMQSEMEVFISLFNEKYQQSENVDDAINFARSHGRIFPSVLNAYRLMATAPATVSKNERTFSKLKTVKNFYHSRMLDERLDDLILMACERDLTDSLNLDNIVSAWRLLKNRRLLT
jgi:hypothetical protein